MDDARRHDQRAAEHELLAGREERPNGGDAWYCGDTVLNDSLTTGGLPVTTWTPCFDLDEERRIRHRVAARRERAAAFADRRSAAELASRERVACAGIPDAEHTPSVFVRRNAIAAIEPVRRGDHLVGVRVIFSPAAGLTEPWLRRDLACHHAIWQLRGRDPTIEPVNPTLVDGATYQVIARDGHLEVLVTAEDAGVAATSLARARGRLGSGPAGTAAEASNP